MKRKAFKKVFSLLLTFSLVVSIIVTMTVTASANPYIIDGWVYSGGVFPHPTSQYLKVGDTVTFNFQVTQGQALDFGLIKPNGQYEYLGVTIWVGSSFNYTKTITTAGTYSVFVSNYSTVNSCVYGSYTVHKSADTISNGTYFIKSKAYNYYLDVINGGTANNTQIQQWEFNGTPAQQWKVTHLGGGEYSLIPMHATGMRLDVHQDVQTAMAKIYSSDGSNDQRFRIIKNSDGSYRIAPKVSHTRVLDASTPSQGAKVHLWTYLGVANQHWVFEPVYAFSTMGGLASRTVTIQRIRGSNVTVNDWDIVWTPLTLAARNSWNNSGAGVSIATTTGASVHTLTVDRYTWTGFGDCETNPIGNVVAASSAIRINARTIVATDNARRSTIAHEIGHLFWLADNPYPTNSNASLMNHDRNRETVFIPQNMDVSNVRFYYD